MFSSPTRSVIHNIMFIWVCVTLNVLDPGLDWDKKSAMAFFWSRWPTSTSNYIYNIYIYIYSRRTCTDPKWENARSARLPVQPWLDPNWSIRVGAYVTIRKDSWRTVHCPWNVFIKGCYIAPPPLAHRSVLSARSESLRFKNDLLGL